MNPNTKIKFGKFQIPEYHGVVNWIAVYTGHFMEFVQLVGIWQLVIMAQCLLKEMITGKST